MYYKRFTLYIILLISIGLSTNSSEISVAQLLEQFHFEKNLYNYENAEKLATQIISELE